MPLRLQEEREKEAHETRRYGFDSKLFVYGSVMQNVTAEMGSTHTVTKRWIVDAL